MNVLVVSSYLLPHIKGVEVLVDQEARALAREGHEVVVVGGAFGEGEKPKDELGVRVVRVRGWNPLERRWQVRWPIFGPRLVVALWRRVRGCDVVHVHGFLALSSLIALRFARLYGEKSVLTEHVGEVWYASRGKRFLQRLAIGTIGALCVWLAGRCLVYNERVAELLRGLAGSGDKVAFLANPLDKSFLRAPWARSERKPGACLAGTPFGRKANDRLLSISRVSATIFIGPPQLVTKEDDRWAF